LECAKKLLAESPNSIVFLGGSAMANWEAPNHLTTIDTAIHAHIGNARSVNLAERGARSGDELSRLLFEVVDLHPRYVVFLHGFNEFSSVRYGGQPEDSFHWTAFIRRRIEEPASALLERLAHSVRLIDFAIYRSGLLNSPRHSLREPSQKDITKSANEYVQNISKIDTICKAWNIECLYFLQPHIYSKNSQSPGEKKIVQNGIGILPYGEKVLALGYRELVHRSPVAIVDLKDSFDMKEEVYFDEVHFMKSGSAVLGTHIANVIKRRLPSLPSN